MSGRRLSESWSGTPEIVRLQLRKPKNWNWELSTSKSSPHISLPIIQLFDSKGKLLVEAHDGPQQRRSWHSSGRSSCRTSCSLERCKSDTLGQFESEFLNHLRDKSINCRNSGEKCHSKRKSRRSSENEPKENEASRCLRKSRSELFTRTNGKIAPAGEADFAKSVSKSRKKTYNRTGSDDVYQRLLKSNDESLKRAISDGYRNFLLPIFQDDLDDKLDTNSSNEPKKKPKRNRQLCQQETVEGDFNFRKLDVANFKHNKYITRTSKAGTLIIKEDSFPNPSWRRRSSDYEREILGGKNNNFLRNDAGFKRNDNPKLDDRNGNLKRKDLNLKQCADFGRDLNQINSELLSLQSVEAILNNGDFPVDVNCNYIVQEPPSDYSRKNSEAFLQELQGREVHSANNRRKLRKCQSDVLVFQNPASVSSSFEDGDRIGGKKTRKARVIKECRQVEEKKEEQDEEEGLLQLVKKLAVDHVKMGANVSRHSSKGLGRRSQSSGSICNSKSRHSSGSDGKMCGSLPSYLEDRSNGCNNNHHECDKRPVDEVDRIPPLGDSGQLHWKFSDNQTALCDQGYGSERSPEEEYPPPLPDHDQCHYHLDPYACYPFITPESTFGVTLFKGSRGLGLSVTGGIDSGGSWPGLIRIKRLFPHQPASSCGMLNVGDLLLEANGIALTGLTNYEALEVLRTAANQVELRVCRPPPDVLSCVSPISEVPPPPPRREPPVNLSFHSHSSLEEDHFHGEFEITLTKIKGSLGFTLRKEDDSALGHYVRALVREPALTDGRIQAGDKIIAANDVEISSMSHEQAVQFLRQCGEVVKLRLYRDFAQTPIATLSPTETTPRTSFSRKTHLRQEAVDMLNDIAARKLIPAGQDQYHLSMSPNVSPRRLRRQTCPSDASSQNESSRYEEQFHEGLLQKPFDEDSFSSLFIIDDDSDKPSRPSSLDLYNPNQTPVAARKPKFNFSLAHNAYELNNLDPEVLDAPNLTYNLNNDDVKSTEVECGDSFPQEPVSMPHMPSDNPGFSYKNPAYQSAHPPLGLDANPAQVDRVAVAKPSSVPDDGTMKKWKGVVLNHEDDSQTKTHVHKMEADYQILAIELNRGWNSRLGFSLQGAAGYTYVSAVHADSVAARDGRIKPGDRLIKVNDESVENMTTSEIIDLLRIVRGPVCIVVSRTKSKEDCKKSNAEN